MKGDLLIIGAGQYGAVAKEIAEDMQCFHKIDFLDDNSKLAIGKISQLEDFADNYKFAFVAIGNSRFRMKCLEKLQKAGFILATLIHPEAHVSTSTKVGAGSIIEPFATVQANCEIGKGVLICSGAVIKHNCVVGDGCYIDCNSTVAASSIVPKLTKLEINSIFSI